MRSSRALLVLALAAALLHPVDVWAQDDEDDEYSEQDDSGGADDGESEGIALAGVAYGAYSHSFQDTRLSTGGSFDDGNGSEVGIGFQAGDYLQFLAAWEWQTGDDYDTHYLPVAVRMLSPSLLERVHLYGEVGLGLFFSRLHGQYKGPDQSNERGSAVRLRGGVEVGIDKGFSAIAYGGYLWGLGSSDDYEYATVGVGIQYRWGL